MLQLRRTSLFLLVSLGLVYFAGAQLPGLQCPPLTTEILGSTTEFTEDGLLAVSLIAGGEEQVRVPVRIMRARPVCEASGLFRNTASFASVLVEYQCSGGIIAQCDGTTVITQQFQYICDENQPQTSYRPVFGAAVQTTADFSTVLENRCLVCEERNAPDINPVTHCQDCPVECNVGLRRCYRGPVRDECCNFYNDSRCVSSCGSLLVPNPSTYDCECGELSGINGGSIGYSNDFAIGSVATHTCDAGYRMVGPSTRTCTFSGWENASISCDLVTCPLLTVEKGTVTHSADPPVLDTEATYVCEEGYGLRGGESTRTCQFSGTWSGDEPTCAKCTLIELDPNCIGCTFDSAGNEVCVCKGGTRLDADGKCVDEGTTGQSSSNCSPGCIAGIVLAILGAIIMAIVVTLVVYAVYSYLSNPATKLAKAGTEGLNGVARDNPLYLPPEDIVADDVDKVGDVESV